MICLHRVGKDESNQVSASVPVYILPHKTTDGSQGETSNICLISSQDSLLCNLDDSDVRTAHPKR